MERPAKHRKIVYGVFSDITIITESGGYVADTYSNELYSILSSRAPTKPGYDLRNVSIFKMLYDSIENMDLMFLMDNYLELRTLEPCMLTRAFLHILRTKNNAYYEYFWKKNIGTPNMTSVILSYGLDPTQFILVSPEESIRAYYDFNIEDSPYEEFYSEYIEGNTLFTDVVGIDASKIYNNDTGESEISEDEFEEEEEDHDSFNEIIKTGDSIYNTVITLAYKSLIYAEVTEIQPLEKTLVKLDKCITRAVNTLYGEKIANLPSIFYRILDQVFGILIKNGEHEIATTIYHRKWKQDPKYHLGYNPWNIFFALISDSDDESIVATINMARGEKPFTSLEITTLRYVISRKSEMRDMINHIIHGMDGGSIPWYYLPGCYDWYGMDNDEFVDMIMNEYSDIVPKKFWKYVRNDLGTALEFCYSCDLEYKIPETRIFKEDEDSDLWKNISTCMTVINTPRKISSISAILHHPYMIDRYIKRYCSSMTLTEYIDSSILQNINLIKSGKWNPKILTTEEEQIESISFRTICNQMLEMISSPYDRNPRPYTSLGLTYMIKFARDSLSFKITKMLESINYHAFASLYKEMRKYYSFMETGTFIVDNFHDIIRTYNYDLKRWMLNMIKKRKQDK